MTSVPTIPSRPAAAFSNCSISPASVRWLRSWKSSASSYSASAALASSLRLANLRLAGRPLVGGLGVQVARVGAPPRPPPPARRPRCPRPRPASLGERLEDVGRVVQLDELRRRLDDLGLGEPLAARLVEDAAPAAERAVGRDREVVGVVVDQDEAAELADPVLVRGHEPLQLLARADEEVGPLDLGIAGHVGEGGVASSFHVRPPTGGS